MFRRPKSHLRIDIKLLVEEHSTTSMKTSHLHIMSYTIASSPSVVPPPILSICVKTPEHHELLLDLKDFYCSCIQRLLIFGSRFEYSLDFSQVPRFIAN